MESRRSLARSLPEEEKVSREESQDGMGKL